MTKTECLVKAIALTKAAHTADQQAARAIVAAIRADDSLGDDRPWSLLEDAARENDWRACTALLTRILKREPK